MTTTALTTTSSESDDPSPVVYQLKVVLDEISPMIWRRLLVTSQTTIDELHTILQLAFGWSDEHLHRFTIHAVEYGQWRPGTAGFSHDPRTVPLDRFDFRVGERFTYEYNFHAEWRHLLRVEAILPTQPGRRYPTCTGGARRAPPEHCRDPWEFLELRAGTYSPLAIETRLVEFAKELLAARKDQTVREALGEFADVRLAELEELRRWLRLDHFDRRALNQTLHTHFHSVSSGGRT